MVPEYSSAQTFHNLPVGSPVPLLSWAFWTFPLFGY